MFKVTENGEEYQETVNILFICKEVYLIEKKKVVKERKRQTIF